MRVDVDELLNQAEKIYQVNVEKLGFGGGDEASGLDKYKLEIYLRYMKDWLATGSGYDNVVGALWVSSATCRPVGDTIGHELGHALLHRERFPDKDAEDEANEFAAEFLAPASAFKKSIKK